jgi:hypothetical protein
MVIGRATRLVSTRNFGAFSFKLGLHAVIIDRKWQSSEIKIILL